LGCNLGTAGDPDSDLLGFLEAASTLCKGSAYAHFAQAVITFAHLHRGGLLHYDIKPDNGLSGPTTGSLVSLASSLQSWLERYNARDRPGTLPEVAAGRPAVYSDDVFLLMASFFALWKGRPICFSERNVIGWPGICAANLVK
jgi:serine/threonine protein kinase